MNNKTKNHNIVRKSNISKKKSSNITIMNKNSFDHSKDNNRYLHLVDSVFADEDTN